MFSSKKKDLTLKTSQEKNDKTKILVEEESSNDDDLNANIALMVKRQQNIEKASYLIKEI
jgi:hypothetical protein